MTSNNTIDAARVELLLSELRLPGHQADVGRARRASDKEGWPAARFLAALAEHELADRSRRRIERHLASARLPAGKTFDTFDFNACPWSARRRSWRSPPGDGWLDQGRQYPAVWPARRRQEPSCGRARPRISSRTAGACCSCAPPTSSNGCRWRGGSWRSKPPSPNSTSYHLLILDDIAYVTKDQAETSVLFELIAARYERRSLLITANQPFGEWGKIFPDQAMTLAAIDRLVHHATILEMNVESYRRKAALKRKRGPGD